jgi:hypothetical protein
MKLEDFKKSIINVIEETIKSTIKEEFTKLNITKLNEISPKIDSQSYIDKRKIYESIIQETNNNQKIPDFVPSNVDPINGKLPEGNVGLNSILGLLKKG